MKNLFKNKLSSLFAQHFSCSFKKKGCFVCRRLHIQTQTLIFKSMNQTESIFITMFFKGKEILKYTDYMVYRTSTHFRYFLNAFHTYYV